MDTPPVMNVTSRLYTAGSNRVCANGSHRPLMALQNNEISTYAMKYHSI